MNTVRWLVLLGSLSLALYGVILVLSFQFDPDAADPPLLTVLALLTVQTVFYLLAIGLVLGRSDVADGGRLLTVILFSVAFRLVLLPSVPIQEIDYYRYLWDGRVLANGMSPYHFNPSQVDDLGKLAPAGSELRRLGQIAHESEPVRTVFERVHYRGVPTAYPPLAQLVFALAALTPATAPLWLHVLVLKTLLVGFDLGTMGVMALLLRRLGWAASGCLVWGWCPLVLKEVANSAHFDPIAVFFTILALYLLVRSWQSRALWPAVAASASLALAVLAKSYPVLLVPVLAAFLAARWRWRALVPLMVFAVVLAAFYAPFFLPGPVETTVPDGRELPPPGHPGSGLGAFLSEWQINDLLFMIVWENLRPPGEFVSPWFVVVPDRWRAELSEDFLQPWRERLGLSIQADPALVLTQALMGSILLGLCLRWAWRTYRQPEPLVLLRCAFLMLAWGWLLSAAQNSWYVLWFLPLMPFAGRRAWYGLPGLVLLYYLSFRLDERTFDYGVVWLEYLPLFAALAVELVVPPSGGRTAEPPEGGTTNRSNWTAEPPEGGTTNGHG